MKPMRCALAAMVLLASAHTLSSQTIKVGSLAPAGSPWHNSLVRVGAEWSRISGGTVELRIYPGGVAGDEQDMVRKMRIGQLQAAGITAFGLTHIGPEVGAMLLPLFVSSDEELQFVLEGVTPYFEAGLREKGFQLVMWIMTGWMYIFSRQPVVTPDNLKAQKLWVRSGVPHETAAWQKAGFHVVPLSASVVMSSLASGMIDAVMASPLAAAASQWFGVASHMCELKVSPLIGAVVVATKNWDRIPPALRAELLVSARSVGETSIREILGADRQAIAIMKNHGLVVHPIPADGETAWAAAMGVFTESLIGSSVSSEAHGLIAGYLEKHRSR